ncbi:uncharacterized protein LOC119069532 [Bradysia coprophila]|uniref:uncharacterized protein LOC119069532 n=1 Tax=Bradysia coprophila TaxID=38358 RepID=UPI00187DD624|nr:uncharacterized protein LOC119069532 [Bradysia coprophila]
MRAILIISSVLVLATARPNPPDANNGYEYNTPQENYQAAVPEQISSGPAGETLPNFVPVQANDGPALPPVYPQSQVPDNFVPTGPSDVQLQGVPLYSQTSPAQQTNIENQELTTGPETYRNTNDEQQKLLSSSYDALPISGAPQQQQESSFVGSTQQQSSFSGNAQQSSSFGGNFQQQQSVGSSFSQDSQSDELPPIITKHFYVHAAPEEPEESEGPKFVNIGRKQKNYKIIFIKAPTYGFNSQVIPIVQPNEEKTIVYVLSKKPSYNQDISLPPVPVTEPSKPEVFFIKYKTDREAQEAQQKIQGAYESNTFTGSNDNVATNIGTAISGFQNQGLSTFNSFAGQATGILNNVGTAVTNQLCAGGSSCSAGTKPTSVAQTQTANDEEQVSAGASENTIVENLVEPQPEVEQPSQQQSLPQQNDIREEYLPPHH